MTRKYFTISLIIIVLSSSLTGCWSKRELNELSIATAIGIDVSEDGGVLVSVQLLNPSEVAASKQSANRTPVTVYKVVGESVFEAFRKLTQQAPRKIYVAHVRLVVIGEELARQGISTILDFISRDHEFRTDFIILVARDTTANSVLNVLTPLEKIPANKIFSSLEMSEQNWAPTKTVRLDELINSLVSDGRNPVLTGITLMGDTETGGSHENVEKISPYTIIEVENLGVFKEDRLVGWLNTFESVGYNHIDDSISSTVLVFPFGKKANVIGIELMRSKTKQKAKVENGKPRIEISISAEGNVGDVEQSIDLTKVETIEALEAEFALQIKQKVEMAIEAAQKKYNSDIFGFGQDIYRTDPKLWSKLKDNWDDEFKNLPVHITVEAKIRGLGTIGNSFIREIKE